MLVEAEKVNQESQLGPIKRQLSARAYFNINVFSIIIETVLS